MPPLDVDATVLANRRLSRDYNVLTLSAPDVGARTVAGQFVMVRPEGMTDTLLRRPFSVFEVIRDASGHPTAISILNKRAGRTTNRLYEAEPGERIACLGPLGRPYTPVAAPTEAWMVAGGVGLAPFATLAEALVTAGTPTTLFYGARSDRELFYLDYFEQVQTHYNSSANTCWQSCARQGSQSWIWSRFTRDVQPTRRCRSKSGHTTDTSMH